jgi:phospholipid/cholesterol/gamma-HCH transport system substrate-binding protein
MEYFRPDIKVGGTILIALALLVFAALSVGNFGNWFAEKSSYTVLFRDASLLPEGAQVSYAGYPVGQVTAIHVRSATDRARQHPAHPVALTLTLRASVPLQEDARLEMKTNGMIGDRYIDIIPGSGKPLPPGATLLGTAGGVDGLFASAADLPGGLEALISGLQSLLTDTSRPDSIPATLAGVNRLLTDLRPHLTTLTISGNDLLHSLRENVANTTDAAGRTLETIDATITENRPGLQRMVKELNTTLVDVRHTMDTTRDLITSSKTDLATLLQSIQQLVDGLQSNMGTLLARVDKLLLDADEMVLQNDRNVYATVENLRDMTANLEATSQLLRANPAVLLWGNRGNHDPDLNHTSLQNDRVLQDRGRMGRYDRVQ